MDRTVMAVGATLLAFCGALAVLDAERGTPDGNITDFGEAIWWGAHHDDDRRLR